MKILYDGWMKVLEKKINGKTYEILDNYSAVSAIVLDKDNKILLVEQFRPSIDQITLEIPAGCVDKEGKTLEEIMCEELMEEACIKINPNDLIKVLEYIPQMGFSPSCMHMYFLKVDFKGKNIDIKNDDVYKIKWMDFELFEKNIKNGVIKDSKTIFAYFCILQNFKK